MIKFTSKLKTTLPLAVLFAFCWGMPQAALGAGCQYHASSNHEEQLQGFVENLWWATGPTRRVYENGQFTYYQIPTDSLPCHGPSCRGKSPKDTVGSPAVIEIERQTLFGQTLVRFTCAVPPPSTLEHAEPESQPSPILSGLLRPPRCLAS